MTTSQTQVGRPQTELTYVLLQETLEMRKGRRAFCYQQYLALRRLGFNPDQAGQILHAGRISHAVPAAAQARIFQALGGTAESLKDMAAGLYGMAPDKLKAFLAERNLTIPECVKDYLGLFAFIHTVVTVLEIGLYKDASS